MLDETRSDPCFEAKYILPDRQRRVKGIEYIYTHLSGAVQVGEKIRTQIN